MGGIHDGIYRPPDIVDQLRDRAIETSGIYIRAADIITELGQDKIRLDWMERMNTLHVTVEIIYVVDGYEVTIDRESSREEYRGDTLREALDNAMKGGGQ